MNKILCASLFGLALAACANLNTVSRTTTLAVPTDASSNPPQPRNSGVAIHLDAQQRLAFYGSDGKYCAEPSPDALAAYAASLGAGASVPSQGAASLAAAQQSVAASIGLRTQSITLMRDALYRLCEARASGDLSVSETLLLARSQDLTAVVVAVEQLTGAVAANQVVVGGSASSSASASLVANQQLLDNAKKDELAKTNQLAEAEKAKTAQAEKVNTKNGELVAAETKLAEARKNPTPPSAVDLAKLEADVKTAKEALEKEKTALANADAKVELQKELLESSTEVRETIEAAKNAALTNATAATAGTGNFNNGAVVRANVVDAKTAGHIATAVNNMVNRVLDKDYTTDACTTLLTQSQDQKDPALEKTREVCIKLVNAKIDEQRAKAEQQAAKTQIDTARMQIQIGVEDPNTVILRDAMLRKQGFTALLQAWIKKNVGDVAPEIFVDLPRYAASRQKAVGELKP